MTAVPVAPVANPITPPNYNTSGLTVVSGIPTNTASGEGPWFAEEQSMRVDYTRVPLGSLSSADISLSNITVNQYNTGSILVCEITASYQSYKDWASYQTSAWSQPQKFEYISFSTCRTGKTYGNITTSTLGPAGSIVSKQPYYRRVPWNDLSGHSVVTKRTHATTYTAVIYPYTSFSSVTDQTQYKDFKYWWIGEEREGTLLNKYDVLVEDAAGLYYIIGGYNTSQENLWQVFSMLDTLGLMVKNSNLYAIPATVTNNSMIADQGFSEYEITRHDYS